MPRLGAKVCLLRCTLLSSLLILLLCSIHETEQNRYCQQIITERHLAELEELADTQMQHPGRVSFKFINKMQLNDSVCYVKAAFPLLGKILERTEFKENSSNAKKMQMVRRMYSRIDESFDPCIREEDEEERKLSQMCFEEFTTSPYEMLVLVKHFFQDINQLLQNQETFERDCSQVYRRACLVPRRAAASPGVGTDPDCNCLSPALPPATQPSLSAATHASSEEAPASTRLPYSLLHATLTDLDAPSQPPSNTDGGSGTGEVLAAGVGDAASVPSIGMQQPAPADSTEAILDAAGTIGLAALDVPIPRGDRELLDGGTGTAAGPPLPHGAQHQGASILLGTSTPSSGGARMELIPQLRFTRMAPGLRDRAAGGPGARGWGLSRRREPQDGGTGPSFDSGFVLSTEQRRKEPPAREGHREPLVYITVASAVAVLLAMGGLLFYKYRPRVLERPLEDGDRDPEEPERRALQGARECPDLETQDL
ncbi:macrophage colony-stimulating factor 1 isoform X1 [Neopsephotus bourkii]|uniref:macrophage colony-stimulating factor 1 isoform X1 n=1 Tax=Neopsephotus bourkii TaxID=309878 RepID=UPI002AA547E6|nr:macrophage colony-stimulating factor 1 isoform X1 [Neopsephotus bourkii]